MTNLDDRLSHAFGSLLVGAEPDAPARLPGPAPRRLQPVALGAVGVASVAVVTAGAIAVATHSPSQRALPPAAGGSTPACATKDATLKLDVVRSATDPNSLSVRALLTGLSSTPCSVADRPFALSVAGHASASTEGVTTCGAGTSGDTTGPGVKGSVSGSGSVSGAAGVPAGAAPPTGAPAGSDAQGYKPVTGDGQGTTLTQVGGVGDMATTTTNGAPGTYKSGGCAAAVSEPASPRPAGTLAVLQAGAPAKAAPGQPVGSVEVGKAGNPTLSPGSYTVSASYGDWTASVPVTVPAH